MQIRWINDIDPTGNRIFDSVWEAEEWADSLSSDFWAGDMDHVGYFTRDEKVYSFLQKLLPEWLMYSHKPIDVHMDIESTPSGPLYRIWVTAANS